MIKNIVFDMGGVIMRWDPHYIAAKLSADKTKQQILINELFGSVQWAMLDQGLITLEQALEQIETSNFELIKYGLYHWYDYFEPLMDIIPLVKSLKQQGYKIYLLSNCSKQFYEYYKREEAFKYFDDFYISADYQLLKPNVEIFEHFLNHFDLKSDECIFIDDVKANVEGAFKALMHGYHHNGDVKKLKDVLMKNYQINI